MDGQFATDQGVLFAELERRVPATGRNGHDQLDALQLRFVGEYLVDMNGTAAVMRAGYRAKDAKSASVTAARLLGNVRVQAELKRRLGEIVHASQLTVSGVLEQLRKLAYADIRTMYNPDGTLKAMDEMPGDISARIMGIESEELFAGRGDKRVLVGYVRKVKLTNPSDTLKIICQYLGMMGLGAPGDDATVIAGSFRDASDDDLLKEAERFAEEAEQAQLT